MIDYIFEIITITIMCLSVSYREVLILIKRGSWKYYQFGNIFWETDDDGWLKNFDSFHFSNGLFWLTFFVMITKYVAVIELSELWLQILINAPIGWVLFMWQRNVWMHVILPKKAYKRWWYILPFGGAIEQWQKIRKKKQCANNAVV